MKIVFTAKLILDQLAAMLNQLDQLKYTSTLDVFSGASLGGHTRHILEFYQCLLDAQSSDEVCYDNRKRDKEIESQLITAQEVISQLQSRLDQIVEDKPLRVIGTLSDETYEVNSSLSRELLYAVEHAVHHMAIIKIGLLVSAPEIVLHKDFGVAASTVRYKQSQCAQ